MICPISRPFVANGNGGAGLRLPESVAATGRLHWVGEWHDELTYSLWAR